MRKSHLLIDESPLQVLPSLASAIGLEEAIVLQQLHYWLSNPKNSGHKDEDGNKWVFNTYEQWQEDNFPFWSTTKIQRIFLSLEKSGVIISSQIDAHKHDMRKFYRIDYDILCTMHGADLQPSIVAKLHDDNSMAETTPETNNTNNKNNSFAEISKLYEQEIGVLTGMIAEEISLSLEEYPQEWFAPAMREAAMLQARNWKYVRAILSNWKKHGFGWKPKPGRNEEKEKRQAGRLLN